MKFQKLIEEMPQKLLKIKKDKKLLISIDYLVELMVLQK